MPPAQGRACTSRVVVGTRLVLRSVAGRGAPSLHERAPGRALCQPLTVLQPSRRSTALAATAGEAGENKAERTGTFFNRKAELQSLTALLAGAPKAVLVMTGPPSCGKSGARSLRWHSHKGCDVVTRARAPQRCSSSSWRA